ncbi:MAG: hypothetical protein JNM40_00210 [Myxococcales bacterium]|nr:hypothetical protein [Myxococcales bacterium]
MSSKVKSFFRAVSVSAALLLGAATVSGCGPAWTVVRQAQPSPFNAQSAFAVEPIAYEGLKVGDKNEADYLAEKKPEQVEAWRADLGKLNQAFADTLVKEGKGLQVTAGAAAAPGPYSVKPMVSFIEPGVWAAVVNIPSEVRMTLRIVDGQGTVVDEVSTSVKYATQSIMGVPVNVSVTERLNECGKRLGESAAQYLKVRASVK